MRAYVCAQCHVTYYFRSPEKRLTFPWPNGLKLPDIIATEDNVNEWVHKDTGAPMMKARHPEFETWSQSIHARSGVACADCHMPYMREGGRKISDHNVRSPLLNINRACQTCHHWPEQELRDQYSATEFAEAINTCLQGQLALRRDVKSVSVQFPSIPNTQLGQRTPDGK